MSGQHCYFESCPSRRRKERASSGRTGFVLPNPVRPEEARSLRRLEGHSRKRCLQEQEKCFSFIKKRGLSLLESLVAITLFSILLLTTFQSFVYLNHYDVELSMHRLALHQIENFISETRIKKLTKAEWRTWHHLWENENKTIYPYFSSIFRCHRDQCEVQLGWKNKTNETSCAAFFDSCLQFAFTVQRAG